MESGAKKSHDLTGQINSPVRYDAGRAPVQSPSGSVKEMDKIKIKLDDFKKKILKKFPSTLALGVLPAGSFKIFEEDSGMLPEEIEKKPLHMIMIVPESEYKNIQKKIKPETIALAKETKENLWIHIKDTVDVWNYGLDSRFDILDSIAGSFPLHDRGIFGALRVASIHKTLVLRKFDKYVASYVIAGSLVRGTADKTSDVDVFVVVDDTDVKRMPRMQLLERLRGMILDYVREATALAGVQNILNVQVYLLTDFWDSVRDANPVMFTFIRDGIPLHDRGTFLPWKSLLQMGKIKPSSEAVDKFMKYGEQNEALVTRRLLDAMVDIYWGVITPTQALMMLAGNAPPVPKTIVQEVRKAFVQKEKIMSSSDLKILEKAINLFKDYEHGRLKKISGAEIDKFLEDSKKYDKNMKEMRKKLEAKLISHEAEKIHSEVFGLMKNILGDKGKDAMMRDFESELVKKGKMQKRFLPVLREISNIKQKVKNKRISQSEFEKVRKDASEIIRELIDYSQRKELVALEKGVMHVRYAGRNKQSKEKKESAELVTTDSGEFLVDKEEIKKISGNGFVKSDRKELEEAISKTKDGAETRLNSASFSALKKEFGDFDISF